jgi:predicted ATPase
MIGIFLDNYRGFSRQFIELTDVNFLVGENSTGKTSFLTIIKLMSDDTFWIETDFNKNGIKLGSFNEIISSVNEKVFTLGIFMSKTKGEGVIEPYFRLVSFIDEKNLPVVSKHSFIVAGKLVTTIIKKDQLLYKHHAIEVMNVKANEIIDICFNEHKSTSIKGYKKITAKGFPRELFFAQADKLVAASFDGEDYLKGKNRLEVFVRSELPRASWMAPIRAKPESFYEGYKNETSADGSHVPYLLNEVISNNRATGKKSTLIESINNFGISSGLFEQVDTKSFAKNLTSPFEMHVVIDGKALKICNVGYGISQVLPIVTEILARPKERMFLMQQPEVHLHPKAQAALGEFIYEAAENNKRQFLIETHSDYLIDRFRLKKNKDKNTLSTSQVLFFEREGITNKVYSILIDKNGSYPQEQPDGFRKFFINEELDLLRL